MTQTNICHHSPTWIHAKQHSLSILHQASPPLQVPLCYPAANRGIPLARHKKLWVAKSASLIKGLSQTISWKSICYICQSIIGIYCWFSNWLPTSTIGLNGPTCICWTSVLWKDCWYSWSLLSWIPIQITVSSVNIIKPVKTRCLDCYVICLMHKSDNIKEPNCTYVFLLWLILPLLLPPLCFDVAQRLRDTRGNCIQ